MNRLLNKLRSRFPRRRRQRDTSLHFEQIENRRVMSASTMTSPPSSIGAVQLDNAGELIITGTDAYADNVQVSIDGSNGKVRVTITNIGAPLVREFAKSSIQSIGFEGLGGNDTFNNVTAISSTAYGGAGNDTLLGGSDIDTFFGGDGNDYLDGRDGNDTLNGDGNDDLIFGDAGNDTLHGGGGLDQLYGGQGNDALFGEDDSDQLDGGTGSNQLFGGAGADQLYSYSIPKSTKARAAFALTNDFNSEDGDTTSAGYDPSAGWFDAKLSDASIRSLVRLDFQDDLITRSDVLGLYTQIETDGKVSAAERKDLFTICDSDSVTMSDDVRELSSEVISRGPANRHYQGKVLGSLQGGDSSSKLEKLVDKWFYGGDLPKVDSFSQYETISGSLFVNGPSYTDAVQGFLGDCYLMSSLAEVAVQDLTVIENMFIDNGDGTFAVRFFQSSTARYVTVNRELPVYEHPGTGGAEYASFGGPWYDGHNELWVALAEKAYAQINEEGWIRQGGTNSYKGISGGSPVDVVAQITGHSTDFTPITSRTSDAMLDTIVAGFQHGDAITLATKNHGTTTDIVPGHSYAMVGYDSGTQRVTLYNPWGLNNGSPCPGLVTLSWSELTQSFAEWETGTV